MNKTLPVILGLLLLAAPRTQAQFLFLTNANNTLTITNYTGAGGDVTIPTNFNSLPVTSIGSNAFANLLSLTSVTIPGAITNIGNAAFDSCGNLASVSLANGITSIGTSAFVLCSRLASVTIPGTVTNIGQTAFLGCAELSSVTLDNGVTSIGEAAFNLCTNLTSVTIPGSVTNIGQLAFQFCQNLATITIPGSVTNIGQFAFEDCYSLSNAYFKGNAPIAASNVFEFDTNATAFYFPHTTGWSNTFGGIPAVLWNPLIQVGGVGFGLQNHQFGFKINGPTNLVIVLEVSTNLTAWTPLQTLALTNGSVHFTEPFQGSLPRRYYRITPP